MTDAPDWKVSIQGIQEVMRDNQKRIAALQPGSAFDRELKYITLGLHRYAVTITHVWKVKGGALRASHRMKIDQQGRYSQIYIDPGSVNPRGQRPGIYGHYEHARGGSHAFYQRAVDERSPALLSNSLARLVRAMKLGNAVSVS